MGLLVKKSTILAVFAVAIPLLIGGCNKKASTGICKQDSDCRVDASGKTVNGVCFEGKCEECREDTDCSGLKQCVNNRCEASCSADADCGDGKHCENNICATNCNDNTACGGDKICSMGRCVAELDINGEKVALSEEECKNIGRIHFDFDRYDIKGEYQTNAKKLGYCLQAYPALTVTILGHTDERGTPAYNMILGEMRANAIAGFLKNMGIASARIKTVSYGAQTPLVKESNEYAWQQNRRAEMEVSR